MEEVATRAEELALEPGTIQLFLNELEHIAIEQQDVRYASEAVERDDHVFGCFHKAQADLVLTSDKALIRRLRRLDIPAVRPSEFQAYLT